MAMGRILEHAQRDQRPSAKLCFRRTNGPSHLRSDLHSEVGQKRPSKKTMDYRSVTMADLLLFDRGRCRDWASFFLVEVFIIT